MKRLMHMLMLTECFIIGHKQASYRQTSCCSLNNNYVTIFLTQRKKDLFKG